MHFVVSDGTGVSLYGATMTCAIGQGSATSSALHFPCAPNQHRRVTASVLPKAIIDVAQTHHSMYGRYDSKTQRFKD